jgi:hypothetical protein
MEVGKNWSRDVVKLHTGPMALRHTTTLPFTIQTIWLRCMRNQLALEKVGFVQIGLCRCQCETSFLQWSETCHRECEPLVSMARKRHRLSRCAHENGIVSRTRLTTVTSSLTLR